MTLPLFLGLLFYFFFSPSVASNLGIESVGTISSSLLVILFFHQLIAKGGIERLSTVKEEVRIMTLGLIILLIKIMLGQWFSVNPIIFFFIIPMMISVLVSSQKFTVLKNIKFLLICVFLVECSLSVFERMTLTNYFPVEFDAMNYESEDWSFRSTALFGHPLNNALCVSVIMAFILTSSMNLVRKTFYLLFGFTAILCFNARFAIIIWAIILSLFSINIIVRRKANNYFSLILALVSGVVFYTFYNLIIDYEIGGRIIQSEILDESTLSRLNVYDAINFIERHDLVFGNASRTAFIIDNLGSGGIENSIVLFVVIYGIPVTLFALLLYFQLVKKGIVEKTNSHKIVILFCFIGIGLSNNGLVVAMPWSIFVLCKHSFATEKAWK